MKAAILLISLVTILPGVPARANPAVQGAGAILCKNADKGLAKEGVGFNTWGQGFLSGLNTMRYVGGTPGQDLNPQDFQVTDNVRPDLLPRPS